MILPNKRGLVELIILNVGLGAGILSSKLYAMFVLMAIVTTLLTTPVFRLLDRRGLDLGPERQRGTG